MRPPTELTYSQMAGATCFSLHPSLKWKASRSLVHKAAKLRTEQMPHAE